MGGIFPYILYRVWVSDPFCSETVKCEIGLGVNVPESGSGFFLSDINLFVIIRVLEIWFRSEKGRENHLFWSEVG